MLATLLLGVLLAHGCDGAGPLGVVLDADVPLHLEEHLDAATILGSEIPSSVRSAVEWSLDGSPPDWHVTPPMREGVDPVIAEYAEGVLRLALGDRNRNPHNGRLVASLYVDLPGLTVEEWSHVEVRARVSSDARTVGVGFNYSETDPQQPPFPFYAAGDWAPLVSDGTLQTYRIPLRPRRDLQGPWTEMELWFNTKPGAEAAQVELQSVRIVPRAAAYASERVGVRAALRERVYRRTLYAHTPGRLEYRVRIPAGGRLNVALGVLARAEPVTFRVTAVTGGDDAETLLERTVDDPSSWQWESIDMAHLSGDVVTLGLDATSASRGATALWGGPTVSGVRTTERPNVIFYVIDGAGADYMSLYGYNRATTPNLERIASEGAVFERAYSNAHWTRPSTASFMTSLQHGVLGGFVNGFNVVPREAPTMAERMHRAGYSTAVFNANPNAGRMSGLERGVDFFKEDWEEFSYTGEGNYRVSSRVMHDAFWRWRAAQPAEPYWTHFQTVDVHEDFPAVAPFAGLFVGPGQRRTWREWDERLRGQGGHGVYSEAYAATGIRRPDFFALHQGLYDETMAHQDHQLGRLLERLRASGEWENTLLIVGSDHSIWAAMDDMGVATLEQLPPRWSQPMFRPSWTRVPLLFVWPGRIAGGQWIHEPVSMIDVLPTILDLLDLPEPRVTQGQSLAPLLLNEPGWEPRPVFLEEFVADLETGQLHGVIEVLDGRWGASLEIGDGVIPLMRVLDDVPADEESLWRRPAPLLLYDLWSDPMGLISLHEERPDLVRHYSRILEDRFVAHRDLSRLFSETEDLQLSPEQLRALRSLGYIR